MEKMHDIELEATDYPKETSADTLIPGDASGRKTASPRFVDRGSRMMWMTGGLLFTLLDLVLLGLTVKVSVDLARLHASSSHESSPATPSAPPPLLEDSPFCLPCTEVYLNEIEILQNLSELQIDSKEQWNASLCCAPAHDDLSKMVGDMFIRVHYERDRAQGKVRIVNATGDGDDQSDVITPHILLQLDEKKEPTEVNATHKLHLRFKRDVDTANANRSADLRDGVVQIVHSGHFYIYSQVPFTSVDPSPLTRLTQFVHRVRTGGGESLLLENSVFPCDVKYSTCEHSFVGGLFLLEKGDEIELRVSNHTFVDKDRGVEFGVHHL